MGKSDQLRGDLTRSAGHPHVGGEICHGKKVTQSARGPSPRGWGNQLGALFAASSRRAIPTWVGKSRPARRLHRAIAGHPHVGGEIKDRGKAYAYYAGPSPRGWGNQRPCRPARMPDRAIPTWVGKSEITSNSQASGAGHPHVGGEILARQSSDDVVSGPSPRGWGNRGRVLCDVLLHRAIPTWVGKSGRGLKRRTLRAGHPHVGGEIFPKTWHEWDNYGPSPRGWGNHIAAGRG